MKNHYDVYFVRYVNLKSGHLHEQELTEFGLKLLYSRAMFQVFHAVKLRTVRIDQKV